MKEALHLLAEFIDLVTASVFERFVRKSACVPIDTEYGKAIGIFIRTWKGIVQLSLDPDSFLVFSKVYLEKLKSNMDNNVDESIKISVDDLKNEIKNKYPDKKDAALKNDADTIIIPRWAHKTLPQQIVYAGEQVMFAKIMSSLMKKGMSDTDKESNPTIH